MGRSSGRLPDKYESLHIGRLPPRDCMGLRREMCFVDDDEIPAMRQDFFRPCFEVVDTRDNDIVCSPDTLTRKKPSLKRWQQVAGNDDSFNVKHRGQCIAPLIPKVRRNDDKDSLRATAGQQLRND